MSLIDVPKAAVAAVDQETKDLPAQLAALDPMVQKWIADLGAELSKILIGRTITITIK